LKPEGHVKTRKRARKNLAAISEQTSKETKRGEKSSGGKKLGSCGKKQTTDLKKGGGELGNALET